MTDEEASKDHRADRIESQTTTGSSASACPFHQPNRHSQSDSGYSVADRVIDRRSFMRTALAIGGVSALAAVSNAAPTSVPITTLDSFDIPRGPRSPHAFPERQHAWNQDLHTDPFGNVVLPNYQVVLFLDYLGDGVPAASERREAESAFRTLELAFQRLTGGDNAATNEGLVFMVGYSRTYFDRFAEGLPESVSLLRPETVLRQTNDDPGKADHSDAVVVLSSDTVPVLLGAELALFGSIESLNGVDVRGSLTDLFEIAERRTAFVGKGLPREKLASPAIHADAPLSMGYKSGFKDNVASEDAVSITTGPFRDGTTFQVSKLRLDLEQWYERSREDRDELMFSHKHAQEDIGEVGEGLADASGVTPEIVRDLETTARERGRVGHAAKAAQARNDEFEPVILRRSEGVNNAFHADGKVDFNFTAVMETIENFVLTRQAMDAPHLDDVVADDGHGILPFMEVTNRATFLIPPRRYRSLPWPHPSAD